VVVQAEAVVVVAVVAVDEDVDVDVVVVVLMVVVMMVVVAVVAGKLLAVVAGKMVVTVAGRAVARVIAVAGEASQAVGLCDETWAAGAMSEVTTTVTSFPARRREGKSSRSHPLAVSGRARVGAAVAVSCEKHASV
jgi:antitoxin (DNA-binding transcriptional repressor) of toxin-antitoxin stability system